MTALCELMCSFGISRETTQKQFEIALERGYAAGRLRPSREPGPITRMADLCRRWYFEKSYVDKIGKPRALTWNGRTGTLLKLARTSEWKEERKSGYCESDFAQTYSPHPCPAAWIPRAQVVAPSGLDSAQVLRTATMVERLLRTVAYNSERNYRGDVLLEVMAQVPRLPARDIWSFKKFAKAQGLIFAMSVDDWLESRNIPRSQAKSHPNSRGGSGGICIRTTFARA